MQAIWTQEEATFDGELVHFEGVRQGPKPLQQPHPPILVGGEGERAQAIARELGAEWFPHAGIQLERAAGLRLSIFDAEAQEDVLERYAAADVERCVLVLPST
jgi:alkanesulfonate monooxygenase SsuD/methylene tetrahydromethanopterin reductase-like flavin-dependent oxidoreductase (luciferase family)